MPLGVYSSAVMVANDCDWKRVNVGNPNREVGLPGDIAGTMKVPDECRTRLGDNAFVQNENPSQKPATRNKISNNLNPFDQS
jgi:hypothetical protein